MKDNKNKLFILAAVNIVLLSFSAQAENVVYKLDRSIGAGGLTGTIETDGAIGALDPDVNIKSWRFEVDDGSGVHPPIVISSESGGFTTGAGWDYFTATESELRFDFEAAYAFAELTGAFADVQFAGETGAINESVSYGFAASPAGDYGRKENLIHFFPGDAHYVESSRSGDMLVATTGNGIAGGSRVLRSVHVGGPDICEEFGLTPGCDGNYSGSAVLRADGRVTGEFIDTWAGGGLGVHWTVDCLYLAGNDAWLSGEIKRGLDPYGNDLAGIPIIVRVRDNGGSATEQNDEVSYQQIGNATSCDLAPDLTLYEYVHGQVNIK